jgi:hypothetical protein
MGPDGWFKYKTKRICAWCKKELGTTKSDSEQPRRVNLLISTEKHADVILLRIDEMEARDEA